MITGWMKTCKMNFAKADATLNTLSAARHRKTGQNYTKITEHRNKFWESRAWTIERQVGALQAVKMRTSEPSPSQSHCLGHWGKIINQIQRKRIPEAPCFLIQVVHTSKQAKPGCVGGAGEQERVMARRAECVRPLTAGVLTSRYKFLLLYFFLYKMCIYIFCFLSVRLLKICFATSLDRVHTIEDLQFVCKICAKT